MQRALGTDLEDPLELERLGTVTVGAIGGSVAGSRTPIAPGPGGLLVNPVTGAAVGGLAGVIAGAVAPEATMEAGEFMGVLAPGTRDRLGLSNEQLRRVVEGEALLELATLGAATGIRQAGRFIGRGLTGIKASDEALARQAAQAEIELAPFQMGDRGLGRGIINVLGRFPFLGSKARSVGEAAEAAVKLRAEGAPARIANVLSSSTVGEKLWADARQLMKHTNDRFEEAYGNLFLKAADLGVPYRMDHTREATRGVLLDLASRQPVTQEGIAKGSAAAESVNTFLRGEGYDQLAHQSLGQADELIKKIDEHIGGVDKSIRGAVSKFLSPVRGALKADIAVNGIGPEAKQIAEELASIDADFSATMAQLFETSAAKRFTSVQQGGLRTAVAPSERATRMPVDRLASILPDLNSPQIMDELSRVVTKETYRDLAALKLGEEFGRAIKSTGEATTLNADVLGKAVGVTGGAVTSGRREAIKMMLERSASELTYQDLESIVKAAQVLSNAPIPNASAFIARRATLAGAGSMLRGVLPVAAFTGGGAAAAGGLGAVLGGLAFLFGGRGLVSAVSNPLNARALKDVISEETSAVVKRAAYLNLARSIAGGLQEAGEMGVEAVQQMMSAAEETADELFPPAEK